MTIHISVVSFLLSLMIVLLYNHRVETSVCCLRIGFICLVIFYLHNARHSNTGNSAQMSHKCQRKIRTHILSCVGSYGSAKTRPGWVQPPIGQRMDELHSKCWASWPSVKLYVVVRRVPSDDEMKYQKCPIFLWPALCKHLLAIVECGHTDIYIHTYIHPQVSVNIVSGRTQLVWKRAWWIGSRLR